MGISTIQILRDARATGETVAAIDRLLELGYPLERADRAARPYEQPSLATRVRWAIAACAAAEAAYDSCECDACREGEYEQCHANRAHDRADLALRDLRAELASSDEPREYTISSIEETWTIVSRPGSLEADIEADLKPADVTYVWHGTSSCELTDEQEHHRIVVDPIEPPCVAPAEEYEHDWRRPAHLVEPEREVSGVVPNTRDVTDRRWVESCCARCGRFRVTSAASDQTGRSYYTVTYRRATDASRAWVASR